MKKSLLALLLLFSCSLLSAKCVYNWDQIRENQLFDIECNAVNNSNAEIVIDYRSHVAVLQFYAPLRQTGVNINDSKAFKWPSFYTANYVIRFDPDVERLLKSIKELKDSDLLLWPPCPSDDCPGGTPRIIPVVGSINRYTETDQRTAQQLVLAGPKDFSNFTSLFRYSRRVVLEVNLDDPNNRQLIFVP